MSFFVIFIASSFLPTLCLLFINCVMDMVMIVYHRDQKRVQILENYTLLATKQKSNVDRAMQSFIEMLEEDKDYLPAVLGMSTGFMIEKAQVRLQYYVSLFHLSIGYNCFFPIRTELIYFNCACVVVVQHKARNLLKRVAKMEMSNADGEDFEKSNLFLAKFYVDKVSE